MMNNDQNGQKAQNDPNDPLADVVIPSEPGKPSRRTIVSGAAWGIPVIAVAVGTPLAAASPGTPTLAFTNGPYTARACSSISIADSPILQLTTDGTTPAGQGQPVVITLSAGLTWQDGTTAPKTFLTNNIGQAFTNASIETGANNGTFTITATSGTAVATAPVVVTGAGSGLYVNQVLVEPDARAVALGINGYVFEKLDGSVWQHTTNAAAAVQVVPADTFPNRIFASTWNPGGENATYCIMQNGELWLDNELVESATVTQVLSGSNGYIFVKSDGSIWERTTGSTSATQIAPAGPPPAVIVGSAWGPENQAVYIFLGEILLASSTTGITDAEFNAEMLAAGPNGYVFGKDDGSVWEHTNNSPAATMVAPAGSGPTQLMAASWVTDGTNVAVYISNGTIFINNVSTGEDNVRVISGGVNGYVFEKTDGSLWQHTANVDSATQLTPTGPFPLTFIASAWNPNSTNDAYYIAGTPC